MPILHSAGIDDLGSCVDFLTDEKRWKERNGIIEARDWELSLPREELIAYVEENELESDLRGLVAEVWGEIEEATMVQRKRRYE